MKKLIFLFLFLQISYGFAQRPNGGRRGNQNAGQRTGGQERAKFDASKAAGIFEYSSKKVLKKLKLKKNDSISEKISESIEIYNTEINKIKVANKDLFEGLDIVVNQNMDAAMKNRNRELMRETMGMIQEKLKPIKDEIKAHQDVLNASMASILKEDQNEKWLSYQKAETEKLLPKRKQGNDARNRPDDLNGKKRRRG